MDQVRPARASGRGLLDRRPIDRLKERDPGLRALKRSVRAAIFVPTVFAIATFGIDNDQASLFSVFGAVALLLFVDFGGPRIEMLRSYVVVWIVGSVFIVVATLCSTHAVLAVASMAVVGFCVLFAGIVNPQAAVASTAILLTFVLPVAEPAQASAIGDRLLGWALAGAICIPAALLLWTGRWHDRLRRSLADAAAAVAEFLDTLASAADVTAAAAAMDRSLAALREQFEATPYRPAGAGPTDVALTNLVSRMEWVGARTRDVAAQLTPAHLRTPVVRIETAASRVLHSMADPLHAGSAGGRPDLASVRTELSAAITDLTDARTVVTDDVVADLVAGDAVATGDDPAAPGRGGSSLGDVDPTFPARMLAFVIEQLGEVALDALGGPSDRAPGPLVAAAVRSYGRVALGHLTPGSVWFRNSVRGAVALAAAVVVVEVTSVEHGFWVILGTLSVLRSNALGTGSTAVRAVVGTAAGFVLGSALLAVLGTRDPVLWAILPVAVLVAGIAPSTISFTAGQAGFTVLVVVIFNIIDPVGSSVGLIRVEDVVIGTLVSVVVGLLFWPRGATAALSRTMVEAYRAANAWLVAAVDRLGPTGSSGSSGAGSSERTDRIRAMSAARRLDDAYREYLTERGAKRVPLPMVTRLLVGCAGIRLTARTLESLPVIDEPGDPPPIPEVEDARAGVMDACHGVDRWFADFAASLGQAPQVPPPRVDRDPTGALADAWAAVRGAGRTDEVFAVLRLLWVEERLEGLQALQRELAGTAAHHGAG